MGSSATIAGVVDEARECAPHFSVAAVGQLGRRHCNPPGLGSGPDLVGEVRVEGRGGRGWSEGEGEGATHTNWVHDGLRIRVTATARVGDLETSIGSTTGCCG